MTIWFVAFTIAMGTSMTNAVERQITYAAKNHNLDNNDNFSPDGRCLCYDTRETVGPGIENCQSIEKVEIATGAETVLYTPEKTIIGAQAAPGVGAASYSFVADKVAFIHGPPVDEVAARGFYAKSNRNGAEVTADGSGRLAWLDKRDVSAERDTTPGAHRGGTHRHEYTRAGNRIGFTYDDFLLQNYDRTIGYLEPNPSAPAGATHYFAVLVRVVPVSTARPGDIVKAYGDSWVDARGTMRAFIGKVRDGEGFIESLFVADVPLDVDITTADPGSDLQFPLPPEGVRVRRLTHDWAGGIVRGSLDGTRIAYYAKADDGTTQLFVVPADGLDQHPDPAKRPVQVTRLPHGAGPGLRWHPNGKYVACISNNGVAVTRVADGPRDSVFLTAQGDAPERSNLVWSHDGRLLAFNKPVETFDANGQRVRAYDGRDFLQIFVVEFDESVMKDAH